MSLRLDETDTDMCRRFITGEVITKEEAGSKPLKRIAIRMKKVYQKLIGMSFGFAKVRKKLMLHADALSWEKFSQRMKKLRR